MTNLQIFEDHTQWKTVKEVCRRLKNAGYQALLAGGSVRDLLMNRIPNDFDVATDATPDQVEVLFERSITVGKAFGVTILPYEGFQIEVATFREDLEYKDGRRPEGVKFSTAKADAQRRDFTVNALFLDPETGEVTDFVGGQNDIQKRTLRTVGKPELRFQEDKLRILRAIRFSAQLEFEIDGETLQSVIELASEVSVVSRERLRDELLKLLKSAGRMSGLRLLISTGVLAAAFPEAASFISDNEAEWLRRLEIASAHEPTNQNTGLAENFDQVLWLALFLYPAFGKISEKEFRETQLKVLKIENQTVENVLFVLKNLERVLKPKSVRLGELILLLAKPAAPALLRLARYFEALSNHCSERGRHEILEHALTVGRTLEGKLVEPYLSGHDLKALGYSAGPSVGEKLAEAYLQQLEGTLPNRDAALAWAKAQS